MRLRHDHVADRGEVVAHALGLDAEPLRESVRSGSSLADIAADQGLDVQVVIDAPVDHAADHLERAAGNGRLTDDEVAERLDDITGRIEERVQRSFSGDD